MNVITAITIEMHRKSVDQKHLVQQSDILRSLCCSPCHLWRGSYRQVKINNHQNTTRTIDYDSYQKLIACEAAMQYLREKVQLSKNMYLRYMEPFLFLNYVVVCCGFTREKCNFPTSGLFVVLGFLKIIFCVAWSYASIGLTGVVRKKQNKLSI